MVSDSALAQMRYSSTDSIEDSAFKYLLSSALLVKYNREFYTQRAFWIKIFDREFDRLYTKIRLDGKDLMAT